MICKYQSTHIHSYLIQFDGLLLLETWSSWRDAEQFNFQTSSVVWWTASSSYTVFLVFEMGMLGYKMGIDCFGVAAFQNSSCIHVTWWHPFSFLFFICGGVILSSLRHGSVYGRRSWKIWMEKQPDLKQHDLGILLFWSSGSLRGWVHLWSRLFTYSN